jgi:hypothetical protein
LELNTFEVPEIRLKPEAVEIIKKIYDHAKNDEIHSEQLARILGYAAAKSGGFYPKVKTLITYGLLEGRGKFHVTELGKRLAYPPPNEKDRNNFYTTAVFNVQLWREIYNKYGKSIPESFWFTLEEITGASPTETKKIEGKIKNWYLEDMLLVPDDFKLPNGETKSYIESDTNNQLSVHKPMLVESKIQDTNIIEYNFGELSVKLKRNNIRKSWEKLKRHMDIELEDIKEDDGVILHDNNSSSPAS